MEGRAGVRRRCAAGTELLPVPSADSVPDSRNAIGFANADHITPGLAFAPTHPTERSAAGLGAGAGPIRKVESSVSVSLG
jgi:hypothetical protein